MENEAATTQPPARLRRLVSWQTGRVSTLGARLTAQRMALGARADFAMLAALDEYGELSQAELGRRLGLDRNDVSGVITRLEDRGAVTRRIDADDRRRNIIAVSESGLRELADLQAHADEVQRDLLVGLTAAEREQLGFLLAKVLDQHPGQPA